MTFDRAAAIGQLKNTPEISVLIVGGGINGAGLYRELCLQGIPTVLVDRADFCSGASAAPSRMIHGGLRYLENGEFGLVRESLHERDRLLKNAPHYVHPLPTTIPIFSRFSGLFSATLRFIGVQRPPSNRGAWVIKIGLTMYDFFTGGRRILPAHTFSSRAESLKRHVHLNPEVITTATYYDAWIAYPERLCLELILDGAALSAEGTALNYVSVEGIQEDRVLLRDMLTEDEFLVKPQIVINAGGAWIDQINQQLNQASRFIGGTKGSHLMLDNAELYQAANGRMIYYENADGRVCIMFPLHGKMLVGSTDIPVTDPDTASTEDVDIEYMLDSVRQVFPQINLNRSDIVFHFVGVRPLPSSTAATAGQISRSHQLIKLDTAAGFPIYSMIGGKWTTFRAFAEQAADTVLKVLEQPHHTSSVDLPIGGGKDYPADTPQWVRQFAQTAQIDQERAALLFRRYGTRAKHLLPYLVNDRPLEHHPGYSAGEIRFITETERVEHLDDVVLRRTTLALQGEISLPLLTELAAIIGKVKGWTLEQQQEAVKRTASILRVKHGVQI